MRAERPSNCMSCVCIPNPYGPIDGTRCDALALGRECNRRNSAFVADERRTYDLLRFDVPNQNGFVVQAGYDPSTVRRKPDRPDLAFTSVGMKRLVDQVSRFCIPKPDCSIPRCRRNKPAIGRVCNGRNNFGMPRKYNFERRIRTVFYPDDRYNLLLASLRPKVRTILEISGSC